MKTENRYDVLIFDLGTKRIETVVRKNTSQRQAFASVDFWTTRINGNYSLAKRPAGKFKKGDRLK